MNLKSIIEKKWSKEQNMCLAQLPHGWGSRCAGICRSHCPRSCAVTGTQSWLTELVLSSSPPGISRETWKWAAWLEESSPVMFLSAIIKLKAVFLWGLCEQLTKGQCSEFGHFMRYLVRMCLRNRQARSWKQKNTILSCGGMDRSGLGSPKLICFVAKGRPWLVWVCVCSLVEVTGLSGVEQNSVSGRTYWFWSILCCVLCSVGRCPCCCRTPWACPCCNHTFVSSIPQWWWRESFNQSLNIKKKVLEDNLCLHIKTSSLITEACPALGFFCLSRNIGSAHKT